MQEWTSASRHVASSVREVLETVLDLPAYPRWTSQVARAEVVTIDAEGRPHEAELALDAGLVKDVLRLRYDVMHTPAGATVSWVLLSASQLRDLRGRYEIAATGAGCDVTYRLTVDPGIPLVAALRRKAEDRIVTVALDDLAREVERRTAGAAGP